MRRRSGPIGPIVSNRGFSGVARQPTVVIFTHLHHFRVGDAYIVRSIGLEEFDPYDVCSFGALTQLNSDGALKMNSSVISLFLSLPYRRDVVQ